MQRRSLLVCVCAALLPSGAGCLGADENRTETTTASDAVRRYFQALADGDRERANRFAHPDGDYAIEDDDHPFLTTENLSITETETVDIEAAVRSMFEDPEAVEIDEIIDAERAAIREIQDTYGFSDYGYVRHDATSDGRSFNSVYLLFEDDDWVIWSVPTFHLGR